MTVEICDYVDGHFFCILPKGHEERHGGYNNEDCPWGPFRCVCEGDPAITEELERFLQVEEPGHNVEAFFRGKE
jgi:hypothetical protein